MEKTMTKTAALRAAQDAVSRPIGSGTSWCIYTPYRVGDLRGPTTEVRANSYDKIVRIRANRVATHAIALMGIRFGRVPVDYIENVHGPMSARSYVNQVLKLDLEDFLLNDYDYSYGDSL